MNELLQRREELMREWTSFYRTLDYHGLSEDLRFKVNRILNYVFDDILDYLRGTSGYVQDGLGRFVSDFPKMIGDLKEETGGK